MNKTFKDNLLKRNIKQNKQRSNFSKRKREPKNKANSYIDRPKNNFNTSCNNTNRELINLLEGKNISSITNKMTINENKCKNLKYESKISKFEKEINKLKSNKEKMKENLIPFLSFIKKYSNKLSSITQNIPSDNSFISPENYKEIKLIINNLSKALNNPLLNREIYQYAGYSDFYSAEDNYILQSEITYPTNNDNINNKDWLDEFKNSVEEIINKYEKKINILNEEKDDMANKINSLKKENNSLKEQLNEEKKIKENILNRLNKLKEENTNLEKKNKILDYKCTSYFNKSTQSKFEQKNIEEEMEYKNKII